MKTLKVGDRVKWKPAGKDSDTGVAVPAHAMVWWDRVSEQFGHTFVEELSTLRKVKTNA